MKNLGEKINSTLFDLTHLEINTIIKDEMSASKAPSSPRMMLHSIAVKYDQKLISLGLKYGKYLELSHENQKELFRGHSLYKGSGEKSFLELRDQARKSREELRNAELVIVKLLTEEQNNELNGDIKMIQRIETISDDIYKLLTKKGVKPTLKIGTDKKTFWEKIKLFLKMKEEKQESYILLDFDDPNAIKEFQNLTHQEAEKQELNLDLRQFLIIKKANDIGTEKVVLQTIIGIDGDITTRISQAFAIQPVNFINVMHNEAIGISVKFWENLVNVVVKVGESIFKTSPK